MTSWAVKWNPWLFNAPRVYRISFIVAALKRGGIV